MYTVQCTWADGGETCPPHGFNSSAAQQAFVRKMADYFTNFYMLLSMRCEYPGGACIVKPKRKC